jgi:hypothetical protein
MDVSAMFVAITIFRTPFGGRLKIYPKRERSEAKSATPFHNIGMT